jgi:acyl-CoA synthetase (AMP-forming)/AMP-acid ligase II
VKKKPGSDVTEEDVIDFCLQYLPSTKAPKVVLFGDNIPVTTTGKFQRRMVAPLFSQWKSVQFK